MVLYDEVCSEPMPTRQIEKLYSKRIRNSMDTMKPPKKNSNFSNYIFIIQSTGKTLNEQLAKNLELLTEEESRNYVAYLMNDVYNIL